MASCKGLKKSHFEIFKSSFSEELKLPEKIEEDVYILKVTVTILDMVDKSEASRSFTVDKVFTNGEQRIIEYVMGVAFIATLIALLYWHGRITKLKVSSKNLKRFIGGDSKNKFITK